MWKAYQMLLSSPHMRLILNWVSVVSGNGSTPVRCQAITRTNAGLLSSEPLGTNFGEIWIEMPNFHWWKCIWKCRLPNWRPSCPGGDELRVVIKELIIYLLSFWWLGVYNVMGVIINFAAILWGRGKFYFSIWWYLQISINYVHICLPVWKLKVVWFSVSEGAWFDRFQRPSRYRMNVIHIEWFFKFQCY